MPALRTYRVFISHCWEYDPDYHRLVKWLDEEPLFEWMNLSLPEERALPGDENFEFRLRKRLGDADILVVVAGMEIPRRHWVQWEIKWARIRSIPIVGVRPYGMNRVPRTLEQTRCPVVGWRRDSVIGAIRQFALFR